MKYMLMMNAPRGDGDWNVAKWAPEDIKGMIGFMTRFQKQLRDEGVLVAASDSVTLLPTGIARWTQRPVAALGTARFGRSEGRA